MFKILFLSVLIINVIPSSIYQFKINSIDSGKIDFSQFEGKKILIVNIASESHFASQLTSLEHLQRKYRDSLIVVAIPSNSFSNEKKDNPLIKEKLKEAYGFSFLVAEKMKVSGEHKAPLFDWLNEGNGVIKKEVSGDFHKYLISSHGEMIGYFNPGVDPMSEIVQNAILQN